MIETYVRLSIVSIAFWIESLQGLGWPCAFVAVVTHPKVQDMYASLTIIPIGCSGFPPKTIENDVVFDRLGAVFNRKWRRNKQNGAEMKHLNSTRTARPPKGPDSSSRIQMLKSSFVMFVRYKIRLLQNILSCSLVTVVRNILLCSFVTVARNILLCSLVTKYP